MKEVGEMQEVKRDDLYPTRVESIVKWMRRKDPVAYQEEGNEYLTAAEIRQFNRDGFLILPNVFNKRELLGFNEAFGTLSKDDALVDREEFIREPQSREVRSIFAPHKLSRTFKNLTEDPRIKGRVDHLLDSSTYVHQARINAKPGFNGKEFQWHSDFETWHAEDGMPRMRAISCLITLTQNTAYNGALMLIPGSQKNFIPCVGKTPEDHYKSSLRKQEYGVPDQQSLAELYRDHGIQVAECPPGSLILFDCNVMHGSNSNISPLPRRNIFFVLNSTKNRLENPFSGSEPRPSFIAERNIELSGF